MNGGLITSIIPVYSKSPQKILYIRSLDPRKTAEKTMVGSGAEKIIAEASPSGIFFTQ